jgi:hypothetical protein
LVLCPPALHQRVEGGKKGAFRGAQPFISILLHKQAPKANNKYS